MIRAYFYIIFMLSDIKEGLKSLNCKVRIRKHVKVI